LRRACADMRVWQECGLPPVRVAVNVSPRQFGNPRLADIVESTLNEFGIAPNRICLEVTENVLMLDTPAVEGTIARLQALGIDLLLDDFGTGYSSLGYLKRFPFSKVKIDRSFVEHITTNPEDGAISTAVISMAHSLGIRVVAEGVETEQQCEFLRRSMCDEIQGYLFAAAMPPEAVRLFLETHKQLPAHLLRLKRPPRTLLLVDDEPNILNALKRLLRRDGYEIITAGSGQEGLDILNRQKVDVILSDQRMPGMTGVEFLSQAKEIRPETVRVVLSGYTELQSVTDAVNQGAIYKFLTKPWDDTQLRGHIEEAFQRKEMADDNERLNLEVRTANFELAAANRKLEDVLLQQQQQISRDEVSLNIVYEVLQHVSVPVVGLDEEQVIAFANAAAQKLLEARGPVLGSEAAALVPELCAVLAPDASGGQDRVQLFGSTYRIITHRMGDESQSRGMLVSLSRE
jgi:EAL domain-containing protein (putative c-di-GMP-specific phosphodiesterase class I)/CheY-like chemotaxis protein